jgi:hypothetical protein
MKWHSWICCYSDPSPIIPNSTSAAKEDRQSKALNNARAVFQVISTLGSGGINIPGLQATGQIAMQIIDLVKVGRLPHHPHQYSYRWNRQKIKSNREGLEELVERIADLLDPVQKTLGDQNQADISVGLKEDLVRFQQCVLLMYDYWASH